MSNRSEASSIPHLLVASKTNTNDVDNTSQQRAAPTTPHAVYQDGAWISVDESYDATYNDNHAQDNLDPQDIYHKRLMKRFEALRSTLSAYGLHRSTPARRSIDGANRSTSGPPPSNRHEWLYTIDREFPTEAQISQLDQKSVRRGLEYCVHAMDRFDTISSQKSCWIWTLLAMSGDIGTLDSQKMSHIRDLGNKASQLSSRLHRGPELQSRVIEKDQLHASPATNGAEDVHEASESAVRKDSSDEHDPAQGFVRSDGNERPISTTAITLGTTHLKTPHDLQSPDVTSGISDVSTDLGRDTDTDMNNDTLERARARLLAQLGDNLVQAGIPASSQSPVGADQPDENQDDSQSKVKVRTIPSRAEAERQRQLMRIQYSAAQGSRGVRILEPNTTATGSSGEDHSSSLVDLNTRVTIDMILTVVGECYGQRDLLKFRKAW